jgi:hypothetical protein
MSNHVDRFLTAVTVMASSGHIKQRLVQAYEDNLQGIECEDLPVAARQRFAELKEALHTVPPLCSEGAIRATVRKMSANDADRCALLMVQLLAEMIQQSDSGQKRLPPHTDERPVVPPFLVKSG